MKSVHEISKLTGVSARTLHHYDAIGLLKPTEKTTAGYRLYDDAALRRLQNILMFRELEFPLKEIQAILDSPRFHPQEAISQQIKLLELKKKHLERLISFAYEIQQKGGYEMDFQAFQKTELQQYADEVKKKWGNTASYEEYQQNTKGKTPEELNAVSGELMDIFKKLGLLRHLPPENEAVQEKVDALQAFISKNYYKCTNEILCGLGQIYVEDERMTRNIDAVGGTGTAQFARQAIVAYCSSK
ncbi:MerR family transcriptional regulator [Lachnospiraceae bacterium]|nr:MerR family transcriptional regulator [Lachnospiraceae bacterium]